MKLSLFLTHICCYLALSSASIIPKRNNLENDADPYLYPPPPPGMAPLPYPPLPPAPVPPPTHDLPLEPEIPPPADQTSHDGAKHDHPIPEFPGIPGDENDEGLQPENDAIP